MRLLIIEDEPDLAEGLARGLRHHGYAVDMAYDGLQGWELASTNDYDLLILDLNLPAMDGLEVCRRVRANCPASLILMLTARSGPDERVVGLDLGADDYLVKPFGLEELLARIRAVVRRQAAVASGAAVVKAGDLAIDLEKRLVTVAGREVHLTPTEYELLRYLAVHAGKLITHTILLREVWGSYAVGEPQNTRYVVAQIRRKLGDDPARPRYIATEPGVGYRLRVDEPESK
jgi:two-component system, OmpR family, KDP operon response regulator KdpE